MKTMIATAAILIVLRTSHHNLALAQRALATSPLAPETAPAAGVAPPALNEPTEAPSTGGGGFGGGGVGVYDIPRVAGGRYSANGSAFSYHASATGTPTTVHFSQPDPKSEDALEEDLNVMSLLLQKKLEEAVGENSPTYRMGIPLLLRSGQRSVESLYLDGFGVLFTVSVNFPLVAPPASKVKDTENTTGSDDWNEARKELYGGRETRESANPFGSATVPYDADQVAALKKALLESLKNAANIRNLPSEESVAVTIFGTESVAAARGPASQARVGTRRFGGGERPGVAENVPSDTTASEEYPRVVRWDLAPVAGRGTVLTVRVKKSVAEAFAQGKMNWEQFQQKTIVNAYVGAARAGMAWRGAMFPGGHSSQMAPVAR